MTDNYIRCLTRVVPVDASWSDGYTEPHVIASINIVKQGKQYLVHVTVTDKLMRCFKISKLTSSLSEAATLYEQLLENVFNSIPNNVTQMWLLDNGFEASQS